MARLNPTLKWNEGLPKSFLYLIISAKNFCDDHISGIVSTNLFSHWLQQNSHSLQQVGTLGNQASMVHLFKIYYNIILEMETFKISSAYFQQYVNHELPDVQAGFRKGRGIRDQIANIHWIIEKAREFQKNIYFCFIDYAKTFDCVDNNKLWEILKEMGISDHMTCLLRNLYAGEEAT